MTVMLMIMIIKIIIIGYSTLYSLSIQLPLSG